MSGKMLNCDKCGRFVGKDGHVDVFYDDWNGGYEYFDVRCGQCRPCPSADHLDALRYACQAEGDARKEGE